MGLNMDPLLQLVHTSPVPALSLCHSIQLAHFLLLLPRSVVVQVRQIMLPA